MKINLFKKEKTSSKKAFKPKASAEERARQDWWIIVAGFAVLIVLVAGFDTYLFMKINEGNFFTADVDVQDNETVATKKVLLDTQNFFETRQKEYDAFKAALPAEIDPSI